MAQGRNTGPVERVAAALERFSRHGKSLRSVLAVAGGNTWAMLLGAAGGILAARFVNPETIGSFRAYTIPLMYLSILHLGTFDGLYRQIPLYVGQGRQDLAEVAASSAAAWNLLLSALVSCAFVVVAGWSAVRGDATGALGWSAQALASWGVYYGGYLGATYRTLDHFVGMARIQAVQATLSFAFVFLLPHFGFLGLCARAAVPSLVGTSLLHVARPLRLSPSRKLKPLLDLVRIGLPFCLWGSIYTSVWAAVENTMVLLFGGTKALGLFAVAAVLREGICILPQAVHQVIAPRMVELYAREGDLGSAAAAARKVTPFLALGMVGIVLALSFGLDVAVPILIPNYIDGLALMKLSLWQGVIQAAWLPLNALVASGNSWSYGRGILFGAVAFPIAAWLLAPHLGWVLAIAAGSLAGRAVRTWVGYRDLDRLIREEVP